MVNISIILYCTSFAVIFKKKYFVYEDYRLPLVLSKQPFSMEVFLLGHCIVTIASVYMFIKKVALDLYNKCHIASNSTISLYFGEICNDISREYSTKSA